MEIVLGDLAAELGGRALGDPARTISCVAPLESAGAGALTFFANRKYKREYLATAASAVLLSEADLELGRPAGATLLVVDNPYLCFAKVAWKFHEPPRFAPGVDPRAAVEKGAQIDPGATVLPFAYVGRGVRIGARSVVHAGCVLLDGVTVGTDCILYPGVVIRENCRIGDRTILQPGAIIGGDGFGFAFDPENLRHFKIPHMGAVELGADVEIGSNTTIDRGTIDDTRIGDGTKMDNLVQVGHNVQMGPLCLLAGGASIGGSTTLGAGVVMAGEAGIINHIEIGDGARLAARAATYHDVPAGESWGGHPAIPQNQWLREQAALRSLPELLRKVRALEKRVRELETRKAEEGS